jgi:hypothetical protein
MMGSRSLRGHTSTSRLVMKSFLIISINNITRNISEDPNPGLTIRHFKVRNSKIQAN